MASVKYSVVLWLLFVFYDLYECTENDDVVCLYSEWVEPIESIDSEQRLFELIPNEGTELTSNNVILHLYKDSCSESIAHPFFVGAHYQTGPSVVHLASLNYGKIYPEIIKDWHLPLNCSLFVFIPINKDYSSWDSFKILQDTSPQHFTRWLHENRVMTAVHSNQYGKLVKFYWYERNPIHLGEIKPGEERMEQTFLGHIFKATDAEDDSFIDLYLVDGNSPKNISRDAMNQWCTSMDITVGTAECIEQYEREMIDWAYAFWARKREALNYIQPQIVPNFTVNGFKKTRLPDHVYKPIYDFWKDKFDRNDFTSEEYAGPVMNQYQSPTFMAHLPETERNLLIEYFRVVLAEWAGYDDPNKLEMTSLYGIRKYERDAVLAMHVDTCNTHVLSAIVNVDSKLDDGKDWPLQIYDHFNKLHEYTMEPGDVVFYESAKCGHARRKPLPGDYYANLFIHYKPSGEWNFDWF